MQLCAFVSMRRDSWNIKTFLSSPIGWSHFFLLCPRAPTPFLTHTQTQTHTTPAVPGRQSCLIHWVQTDIQWQSWPQCQRLGRQADDVKLLLSFHQWLHNKYNSDSLMRPLLPNPAPFPRTVWTIEWGLIQDHSDFSLTSWQLCHD